MKCECKDDHKHELQIVCERCGKREWAGKYQVLLDLIMDWQEHHILKRNYEQRILREVSEINKEQFEDDYERYEK